MKLMRSTWTDSRLDDFKDRVDSQLDELSQRISELSARVDGLQHTMVAGFLTLVVIMVSGFMGVAGLIVAKL
jgi:tetrahydromethanopterin S-methyltransferase subunit G